MKFPWLRQAIGKTNIPWANLSLFEPYRAAVWESIDSDIQPLRDGFRERVSLRCEIEHEIGFRRLVGGGASRTHIQIANAVRREVI
jgi:hypothetical protein